VAGGVSSWLQGLMKGMPQHRFTIWAIGAQEKLEGRLAYELPDNVERVVDVYLDSVLRERLRPSRFLKLSAAQKEALRRMLQSGDPDWPVVFDLFGRGRRRNVEFLLSYDFLTLLEEICLESDPDVSFTDYFWTIRSMFLPLLYLLGGEVPQASIIRCRRATRGCWGRWPPFGRECLTCSPSTASTPESGRRRFCVPTGCTRASRICGSTCSTCIRVARIGKLRG
jgi:hypothetical protein